MTIDFSPQELSKNQELRNRIEFCPMCNSRISDRHVTLYRGLINSLYRVYCWCGEKQRHEFSTKDIKHLLGKNEYARFGDLVRFGGIVYKSTGNDGKKHKAQFGINMARAKEFFAGRYSIPLQITLNQITNEIIAEHRVYVNEFPELYQLLTAEGLYDPQQRLI